MKHTIGSKYNRDLSLKEIASRIREDIKQAIKSGKIPAIKTSVRTRRFAGGGAIDIEVVAVPDGFKLLPEKSDEWPTPRHSPEARALLASLKTIWDAYNYDDSNSQVDYFDVNYYGHIQFTWELEDAQRKAASEALKSA